MPILELAIGSAVSFAAGSAAGRCSHPANRNVMKAVIQPLASPNDVKRLITRTPQGFQTQGLSDAVVIIDPLTTGARLAFEYQKAGYKVIRLLSMDLPDVAKNSLPDACRNLIFDETLQYEGSPAETVAELQALGSSYHIVACQIGCEAGVEVFDAITEQLPGFPSNGTELSAARRDKYLMGEQVRKSGLRAVKQQECRSWRGDAANFIASLGVSDAGGAWCVLKPTRSAGTDGVFIAKSISEAEDCFDRIFGAANLFGEENQTVLVQEFLKGTEYIVDSVSLEGSHKCVAVWEYDKRPCNGAQFVYFGVRLYQSEDGAREAAMVDYVHKVITALGVKHGPTHAEVIWLDGEDAPCLVEVGARPHGGEGTFMELVTPVIGYSQVSVMVDAVDRPYRFHRLPSRPARFSGGAVEVCLVARESGKLAGFPLLEEVKQLRSFSNMEIKQAVGSRLEPTIDFLSTPGSINLVHKDKSVVEEDRLWIERVQEEGKFYFYADPLLEKARCAGAGNHAWMCSPTAQFSAPPRRQVSN